MKTNVLSLENKVVGEIQLSQEIFNLPNREDILHRVIEWQRAKRRAGTHKTKTVGEVSGTTKKPYKQKGTGHARQGSLRSGQFRGGATIFGPNVRSHAYDLPKKVRKLGLKTALSAKMLSGKLLIIDEAKLAAPKTKIVKDLLKNFGLSSVLIIDGANVDSNFLQSINNLNAVDILPHIGANVYDILRHDTLLITKEGVKQLEERLK
ncbi:Ribosomal protein L4 [Rickettsiales bacterium Ac37b]|nr:Ribosomal protein L4 [Rickettsiales bacterium Ac37b]